MRTSRNLKGFTLIELLIVIAIIALLASLILVSLGKARQQGSDTRVVSDVDQMRVALESESGGLYTDLAAMPGGDDPQSNVKGELNESGPDYSKLSLLAQDAQQKGGNIFYIVSTDVEGDVVAYALYGQLISTSSAFCLDSEGGSMQDAPASTTITWEATCPSSL